eukprot:XP_001692677.1 predicted protein [Chlamydomonas reinhardtii]
MSTGGLSARVAAPSAAAGAAAAAGEGTAAAAEEPRLACDGGGRRRQQQLHYWCRWDLRHGHGNVAGGVRRFSAIVSSKGHGCSSHTQLDAADAASRRRGAGSGGCSGGGGRQDAPAAAPDGDLDDSGAAWFRCAATAATVNGNHGRGGAHC